MKNFALLVLLTLVSGGSAQASAASAASTASTPSTGNELNQFFQNVEGHWSGKGAIEELQNDGSRKATGFKVDLQVERSTDDGRWDAISQFELDSEVTTQDNVSYQLRGDDLLVSANSQIEPVLVMAVSPLKLTYFMRRAEVLTGRVFDFTFSYELNAAKSGNVSQVLTCHNTVEINGVVISDEASSASHW